MLTAKCCHQNGSLGRCLCDTDVQLDRRSNEVDRSTTDRQSDWLFDGRPSVARTAAINALYTRHPVALVISLAFRSAANLANNYDEIWKQKVETQKTAHFRRIGANDMRFIGTTWYFTPKSEWNWIVVPWQVGMNVLHVNTHRLRESRIFDLTSHFQHGGHGIISRRKSVATWCVNTKRLPAICSSVRQFLIYNTFVKYSLT